MLQQFVEKDGSSLLEYFVVSEDGPEHQKVFNVVAKINNNVVGQGSAGTKKDAEMLAAKSALSLFGISV
jgi:ribonuclease-3